MPRNATKRRWGLASLVWCLPSLLSTPAAFCQVAEPPERADHTSMSAHHMNFSMGAEKCAPTYTYQDGPVGPDRWSGVCQTGNMQSPVNIRDPEQLPIGGLLKFGYAPVDLDEINDCNAYRILVRFPDNDWLKVGRKPYFLTELHFRHPGENAVNGWRPRMAVQLVHLDAEGSVAIVEVPVVAGKENRAMKAVLEHVPEPGEENKLCGATIDATDFLPADRSFYRVPGSLTVPICNEGVTWFVMKHPIEFSEAQISEYLNYYHDTARPLQPSNGRPVAESP
jgi:carbonic anhydrase